MNTISSIINILTTEEKKVFTNFIDKKNKRKDTKNIELFNLLTVNPNAKDIDVLLYGKKAKGAYHALTKRLFDSLVDFVATKGFEDSKSEEMEIIKLLLASRILFEQKANDVALKIVKKAESKAIENEQYGILNEIYYTQIQYSHLSEEVNLDNLIKRFNANKELFQQEENLNLFYATIQNQLISKDKNINQTITEILNRFNISIENGLSYRSLFNILEINNTTANVTRDFYSLLPFIEKVNKELELKQNLLDKHLFYHIQILYYIANSYFRNKDFENCYIYLERMHVEMQKQNKKYYERFLPQYTLVSVLNLNYSGKAKSALKLINEFDYINHKQQITYSLDLKLTTAMILFQQNENKKALSIIREFNHSDNWYTDKAGEIWVIKKNLSEIIFYMEENNLEIVESRIKSFRKKHSTYLKNNNEKRVLEFLSFAINYFYNKEKIVQEEFIVKMKKVLENNNSKNEDVFVQSFYAWLKSKVQKTNLYETTLEIVKTP
jgi:hypothetical protein